MEGLHKAGYWSPKSEEHSLEEMPAQDDAINLDQLKLLKKIFDVRASPSSSS